MNSTFQQKIALTVLLLFLATGFLFSQSNKKLESFLGTWALTLPDNGSNDAGWLEVTQEKGYIDARILWYGGSVVPVGNVYLDGDDLILTQTGRRKVGEKREHDITTRYELHMERDELNGTRYDPARTGNGVFRQSFTGVKLPEAPSSKPNLSAVKYGEAIKLFDKSSLTGWKLVNETRENGWSIKKGVLTNNPVQKDDGHHVSYGNLRTDATFEDFNLKLEVNVPEGNNSGIYLRGIYEIQVVDRYGKALDPHNMGALYSRITPSVAAEKPAGEWQSFDITLVDRHVTIILNGKKIIDNQFVEGCTGGALTANEFVPGPIYLQGDHGQVSYRKAVLTPIIK